MKLQESRPSPALKEENSSLTEDEVSECDSDSSLTNKRGATPANVNEFLGDESPSRMRTRNKTQAKEEKTGNKRPKRGADTTDSAVDSPKTPSKNDAKRRCSKTETPSKGKKRGATDNEMDPSEEKEKRKRSDVRLFIDKHIILFLIIND